MVELPSQHELHLAACSYSSICLKKWDADVDDADDTASVPQPRH
jgi:hypothetical protein